MPVTWPLNDLRAHERQIADGVCYAIAERRRERLEETRDGWDTLFEEVSDEPGIVSDD